MTVKLGAKRDVAVEIDDLAMGYAKRNAERHGVEDRIEFLEEDVVSIALGDLGGELGIPLAANELLLLTFQLQRGHLQVRIGSEVQFVPPSEFLASPNYS